MFYKLCLSAICLTVCGAAYAKPIVTDLSPKNECQLTVITDVVGGRHETELVTEPSLSVWPSGDMTISKVYQSKTGLNVDLRTSPNHLVIASLGGGCIFAESGEQMIQALPAGSYDSSDGSVSVLRYSGTFCQFTGSAMPTVQAPVKLELRCKPAKN